MSRVIVKKEDTNLAIEKNYIIEPLYNFLILPSQHLFFLNSWKIWYSNTAGLLANQSPPHTSNTKIIHTTKPEDKLEGEETPKMC